MVSRKSVEPTQHAACISKQESQSAVAENLHSASCHLVPCKKNLKLANIQIWKLFSCASYKTSVLLSYFDSNNLAQTFSQQMYSIASVKDTC